MDRSPPPSGTSIQIECEVPFDEEADELSRYPLYCDPLGSIFPGDCLQEDSWQAWTVLSLTIFFEVITATMNVLLLLVTATSDVPYIEFVVLAYPRIFVFLLSSYLSHKRRWWQEYLKVPLCTRENTCKKYSYNFV